MGFLSTVMELEVGALLLGSCFGSLYNNNHCSTHSSSNCSFTLNHLFILNMFLIATAVLCLMSIPAHEAGRLFHVGEQKTMNKNHLLESLLKAQVPSSTICQKALTGHNVSPLLRPLLRAHVPPSAPIPGMEVPPLTPTHTASPLLPAPLQKSPPPPPSMPKVGTSIP